MPEETLDNLLLTLDQCGITKELLKKTRQGTETSVKEDLIQTIEQMRKSAPNTSVAAQGVTPQQAEKLMGQRSPS